MLAGPGSTGEGEGGEPLTLANKSCGLLFILRREEEINGEEEVSVLILWTPLGTSHLTAFLVLSTTSPSFLPEMILFFVKKYYLMCVLPNIIYIYIRYIHTYMSACYLRGFFIF